MKKLIQIETKLASLIEKVGVDKVLHFLVGFAFVLAGLMYGLGFSASPAGWGGWALFIVIGLAFIKEKLIDKDFDFVDIWATFAGGVLGMILYSPIDMFGY
jgi:hypothetical protein